MSELLRTIFPPEKVSSSEFEEILSNHSKKDFQKKQHIINSGDINKQFWFVESGFARSYIINSEGEEITTGFFGKGDIVIDWESFFMRSATLESIECLSDMVLWEIQQDDFQRLFDSVDSYRELCRAILVTSHFKLKKYHLSFVADSALERYQKLLQTRPDIVQEVSLKHIASYLGITDTSLSRIRKEMSLNRGN
ncbi:Crp/Fnr family transcriptional regulator [Roseivirga sp.]|uniref:Crp/Fnr family transcriptional regulator n=1 Tax=Roseivirga sp. TaxID=1964215 RepID=UPI003B51AE6B